jgi:WXG100 family type VII secretion target
MGVHPANHGERESMSDAQVQINHADIEAQAKQLGNLKNELETTLQNCDNQIKNLHDSGAFTGLSGASFTETFNEWHLSAQKTIALMDDFGQHLTKTSVAFGEVDQAFSVKI